METGFREETDLSCYGEEGAAVIEKGKRQTNTQGNVQGKNIPIAIGLESEKAQIS